MDIIKKTEFEVPEQKRIRKFAEKMYSHEDHELDGLEMAFYDGLQDMYNNAGDGGISESYFAGVKEALRILKEI